MWKLLFPISSFKILTTTLELTSRKKIISGFEAEIAVLFCVLAKFILSNNTKRLFCNPYLFLSAMGFLGAYFYFIYIDIP